MTTETADPACGPVTWDGEPVYSADTVREGLFDASAFEQMPGQLAMGADPLWFRFVPDDGPTTSFSADSVEDAQAFAARYFHGQPGAIFGPLEIGS